MCIGIIYCTNFIPNDAPHSLGKKNLLTRLALPFDVSALKVCTCWIVHVQWPHRRVGAWKCAHVVFAHVHWNYRCVDAKCVHTLDLSFCTKFTDVSALGALGEMPTLDWSFRTRITDVTTLGAVHTLNVNYCHKITDMSALGGVHELTLSGCNRITDLSTLGKGHTLDLNNRTKSYWRVDIWRVHTPD